MTEQERKHWSCHDCGKNCHDDAKDYYMVKHHLWAAFGVGWGMLCMDCMEGRLGHRLRVEDILPCPLTEQINPYTREILNRAGRNSLPLGRAGYRTEIF